MKYIITVHRAEGESIGHAGTDSVLAEVERYLADLRFGEAITLEVAN